MFLLGLSFLFPINTFILVLVKVWAFHLDVSLFSNTITSKFRSTIEFICFRTIPPLSLFVTSSFMILYNFLTMRFRFLFSLSSITFSSDISFFLVLDFKVMFFTFFSLLSCQFSLFTSISCSPMISV